MKVSGERRANKNFVEAETEKPMKKSPLYLFLLPPHPSLFRPLTLKEWISAPPLLQATSWRL